MGYVEIDYNELSIGTDVDKTFANKSWRCYE